MNLSVLTLFAVFVLIAVRKIGHFNIRIWQSMTCGAAVVLATGEISGLDALKSIDLNVMLFLFGMFVVGQALVASGYLYALAYHLFNRMTSVPQLVCGILFGAALSSALLMNDTLAIIGTPLVLRLAREHNINSKLLLLTLAYAITIGSVMSPLGNPQNFLIASQGGLPAPFLTFFKALAVPTLINLAVTYLVLRLAYRQQFITAMPLTHNPVELLDKKLAKLAQASLFLLIGLITLNIILSAMHSTMQLKLSHIALIAALPPILFSSARLHLLKSLDWSTLLFFAAMFVLMSSVWQTGIMQQQVNELHIDLTTIPAIMLLSASLSQLISNVPLVALYLPMLTNPSPESLMALAAGSTIAGNLLILGAASNVIIIQHAEKHEATLGFFEFARVGIPLGFTNLLIYWVWFRCWYD
ncbi:SLC13 family permease [Methylobacter tundripaludum]|uniref:Citrate transporter n=1 Tax=Methylobacter tundripaludum (strain ATCC BAA-1195 / DSM 17260 / SV96) TaxID=697282 RepID=G3J127_METTV|nr:SLC13 family permease [Methylobacter tundripaludum]EGW20899.1 Citrate transporter [Methylobacter tundripaludum SV96]